MTGPRTLTVLGIETSCDETAAAVVRYETNGGTHVRGAILSNQIFSQIADHAPYGGVVPEIAARAHVTHLDPLIARAMTQAGLGFADLDGVAATAGPGLIGGLIVGLMTAKGIALAQNLPLIAVNHLEGHALTVRLTNATPFPYLVLLVSGGHCQLLWVEGIGQFRRLGTTIDDAVGEAFDKTAKLIGLGHPGGPAVEQAARTGDPTRFALPRPMLGRPGCDFSFSGLKTALRKALETVGQPTTQDIADLAASFQAAVADVLVDRTAHALRDSVKMAPGEEKQKASPKPPREPHRLVIAGGVAANQTLRNRLAALAEKHGVEMIVPPSDLCTDNAAMIAWAGAERLALGLTDPLEIGPRARWPLDPQAQKALGAGIKA